MGFFSKLFGGGGEKKAPVERTLMTLQVGDIVSYFGEDYEIFAIIDWMEEGFSWKEYKMKNRGESFWISAEVDDGEVIAGFYRVIKDLKVETPYPETLEYKGTKFFQEEKGSAIGRLTSKAGTQNYKCKYYEYEDKEGVQVLSIEDYDGEIEVSIGETLNESEVNILPIS